VHELIEAAPGGETVADRRERRIAAHVLQMRDRAGDRLAKKHNRRDIGRQKIHQAAAEMALKQAVAIEIGDLDRQELAPIIGWHDPVDRVLVAEEEAQRHAGGLRQVHEEKARPRRRPHRSTVHRLSSSRRVCAGLLSAVRPGGPEPRLASTTAPGANLAAKPPTAESRSGDQGPPRPDFQD
jgi:hypothetical protein